MITKEQIIEIIRDNTQQFGRVNEDDIANEILKFLQADVSGSLPMSKCLECDKVFEGIATFCSDECREANYR